MMENLPLLPVAFLALLCLFTILLTTGIVYLILRPWKKGERQAIEQVRCRLDEIYSAIKILSRTLGARGSREDIQALREQVEKLSSLVIALGGVSQQISDSALENGSGFKLAQKLLQAGGSPLEVAQRLNMGLAEVDFIHRAMQREVTNP